MFLYSAFSRGVASFLEAKSKGVRLVQLCAKYRQGNATSSPFH